MHEHISDVLVENKASTPNRVQSIKIPEPIRVSIQWNHWRDPIGQNIQHNIYNQDYLNGRSHSHTLLTFYNRIVSLL